MAWFTALPATVLLATAGPAAAPRVLRAGSGWRVLHLALLVGGLFVLAFLDGEQARAADGAPPTRATAVAQVTSPRTTAETPLPDSRRTPAHAGVSLSPAVVGPEHARLPVFVAAPAAGPAVAPARCGPVVGGAGVRGGVPGGVAALDGGTQGDVDVHAVLPPQHRMPPWPPSGTAPPYDAAGTRDSCRDVAAFPG
ncbi:hypothetical protein QA802_25875 [Streptomyces sp. B21-105]|uniref:hypothetical protein n=1 Tax=Streptomyces sp. B21-105 TaxID=3039417 RepID=UPI002FF1BAFF